MTEVGKLSDKTYDFRVKEYNWKKPKNWFDQRQYPHNMQISSAIMQNSIFKHNSVN